MRSTYDVLDTAFNCFISYCVETVSNWSRHHHRSQGNIAYLKDQSWVRYYSSFIQAKCRTLSISTVCRCTVSLTTVKLFVCEQDEAEKLKISQMDCIDELIYRMVSNRFKLNTNKIVSLGHQQETTPDRQVVYNSLRCWYRSIRECKASVRLHRF